MPLISNVGRRCWGARLLVGAIYAILIAGAATMVYPFLMMVSGSFKTSVDKDDFDVFPAFFTDDTVLYRKHIECKFNNRLASFNATYRRTEFRSARRPEVVETGKAPEFRTILPPRTVHDQRVADWREFVQAAQFPDTWYSLGYMNHFGDRLRLWKNREFRRKLMDEAGGDIHRFNETYGAHDETWLSVGSIVESPTDRRYQLSGDKLERAFYAFKAVQPAWFRIYPSLDGGYVQNFLHPAYGPKIADYNDAHGTAFADYEDVILPDRAPDQPKQREDWERYVREELSLQFIRVDHPARPLLAKFLTDRYAGDIDQLNKRYGTAYKRFEDVPYPDDCMHADERLVDWAEFIKTVPARHITLTSPELRWRQFLRDKYGGDLAAVNAAHEAEYKAFDRVGMPTREVDYADFLANHSAIRREFVGANYRQVIDYIVLQGRSLMHTVIYCGLSILLALTVNPLAAYALSRFKLPSTYKILLFCMATMAFPPAVTMIPNFLLLKELHLLNTFAALVLPAMANGFSIFLLKGFFDSLPRELYESAQIDGAGEWTMFWNFSMALSKPILAVLALNAFTRAYGNFMFAFILCPNEKMWTLMVFLYQLQLNGHMALTFAALLVAAIPTFLVFVFCQNIIIRGIVVPVEK